MPATSQAQRRYFGAIEGGAIPRPKGMTAGQVRDFAATPERGLPPKAPHMADGGKAPIMTKRRYFGTQGPDVMGGPPKMMADGGEWMQDAFAHNKGGLHRALNVPEGQTIPAGKVAAATHSKSAHLRHMAQAAKNAR